MTPLKPSSITLFFAAELLTIPKKRKPEVIEIDADDSLKQTGYYDNDGEGYV